MRKLIPTTFVTVLLFSALFIGLSPSIYASGTFTAPLAHWLEPHSDPEYIAEQARKRQARLSSLASQFFCDQPSSTVDCQTVEHNLEQLNRSIIATESVWERAEFSFSISLVKQKLETPSVIYNAMTDQITPDIQQLQASLLTQYTAIRSLQSIGFTIPEQVLQGIESDINHLTSQ